MKDRKRKGRMVVRWEKSVGWVVEKAMRDVESQPSAPPLAEVAGYVTNDIVFWLPATGRDKDVIEIKGPKGCFRYPFERSKLDVTAAKHGLEIRQPMYKTLPTIHGIPFFVRVV